MLTAKLLSKFFVAFQELDAKYRLSKIATSMRDCADLPIVTVEVTYVTTLTTHLLVLFGKELVQSSANIIAIFFTLQHINTVECVKDEVARTVDHTKY